MADIFSATNQTRNRVPTATFDWSHANHLSTDLGVITPIFCELMPNKGSLRINPTMGFQFMPMVFPIQSRIKYRTAFFKYPLRALWTDYRDFIGNFRQDLEEPYIDFGDNSPQTCSLWDYLGLPTTFTGSYGGGTVKIGSDPLFVVSQPQSFMVPVSTGVDYLTSTSTLSEWKGKSVTKGDTLVKPSLNAGTTIGWIATQVTDQFRRDGNKITVQFWLNPSGVNTTSNLNHLFYCLLDSSNRIQDIGDLGAVTNSSPLSKEIQLEADTATIYVGAAMGFLANAFEFSVNSSSSPTSYFFSSIKDSGASIVFEVTLPSSEGDTIGLNNQISPYYSSFSPNKDKQLKISAYAARAYEGIYNSWFRDNRNNPYYLDGEVQYNRWIPNMEGGADPASNYQLRYANWEKDAFTTAVQTPQQGVAPLVGITTYEETHTLEDGTIRTIPRVSLTDEDGRSYRVGFDSDENGLIGVEYQPLDADTTVVKPTSLISLAQSGISINDLRNVNAYQRYLELNVRAGYSYKDIIDQRFDVNVRYSDLLMPEFLGGSSDWVEMHSVTQTVMKEDNGLYADALGSQAGIAGARGGTESIQVFCDEESIILGVVVFTPVPIYTQTLPKHFLYRGLLDHFAPEFANIGFQPILMRELAPIQQWNADNTKMLSTFGYNRPWYEYCQKLDTAHGLYRTQLRNFIMNRTFNSPPALNEAFLLVDPEQVNDVFSVTETTQKIYGQVYFRCQAKLPIPRIAIPRLE